MKRLTIVACLLMFLSGAARAASFTTTGSGNFKDGSTWGHASPGVQGTDYPGPGDFFTITASKLVSTVPGDSISVASGTIFGGTSSSHARLTLNTSTLTFTGGGLALLGSSASSDLVVTSGSVVHLGGYNIVLDASGISINRTWFIGTTNPIMFDGGGGSIVQGGQGGFDVWDSSWTNVQFSSMGAVGLSYGSSSTGWMASSITWVNSARLQLPQEQTTASMYRYIEDSDFRSSQDSIFLRIRSSNPGVHPKGRNDFWHNTASSEAVTSTGVIFEVDAPSVTITNNVFKNIVIQAATTNGVDQAINNNFFASTAAVTSSAQAVWQGSTSISGNFIYSEGDNPHNIQQATSVSGSTLTFVGNVQEVNTQGAITDEGDTVVIPTTAVSSGTVRGNLVIAKRSGTCLLSMQGGSANTNYTVFYNNTVYYNAATRIACNAFRVGETYAGRANMEPAIENNLVVADAADASGNIVTDLNIAAATDKLTVADYNASYQVNGTHYQTTKSVGSYGAHDVTGNPNFVDSSRDLLKWDTSVGGPGTSEDAVRNMLQVNGYGGTYNSAYSLSALMSYTQAGFVPQNTALKGAGFDGTDIGAFSVAAAASKVQRGRTWTSWPVGYFFLGGH